MFWLIVGLVIGFVIIVSIWLDKWNDLSDKIGGSIAVLVLSFAVSLIVLICASGIVTCFADIEYSMVSDTKIIALKDNQNVNGRFYIMGGYVDEDLYYYYAIETEFGYKTEKLKAENAYIKYTDGEPHIEVHEGDFINNKLYFWAFPTCNERYIIYCPEGTITNEFNIDLE